MTSHAIAEEGESESSLPSVVAAGFESNLVTTSSKMPRFGPFYKFRDLYDWVKANGLPDTDSLTVLGRPGYIRTGASHILSAYPKSGKSTLLSQLVHTDWREQSILYFSEESAEVWANRAAQMLDREEEPANDLQLVDVRMVPHENLAAVVIGNMQRNDIEIVVVDTVRECLGVPDENDAAAVGLALAPFIGAARGRTLILVHHASKYGATHSTGTGLSVSGSHAFVGAVDVVLELGLPGRNDPATSGSFAVVRASVR